MRRAFVFGSNGSPAVGRLRYAQHGATQVNARLTDPSCGFVVSSPPPGADIDTVHTCLVAASQECAAGDTFVCYFSGHGHFESELYLCWDDTDPQKLQTTALPAKTLVDDLDRCKATNRLLLLDCCRAAAALKGHDFRFPSILPTDAQGLPSSNFVILAASAALDNVPEFDDLEGTLFTVALCAALGEDRLDADRDADGNISVSDIKHWIDEQTLKHNRRRPQQTAPYPYLFGGQQGQDLYLSFATLPPATLYQRVDVVGRWSRWEARQRDKFSYDQLHGRPETVEPPLSDLFRTSFLVGPSWHNAVATTLHRGASAAASIQDASMASVVSGLRSVDCSRNYEDIRMRLREVVEPALGVVARLIRRLTRAEGPSQGSRRRSDDEEIEAARVLRGALWDLRHEIVTPAYGRCLLIAGGLGAGRTHFVRSLLKTGEQAAASTVNNACLILPLHFSRHFESLDVTLRDAIRQATGIAWSSLEELDAFLGPGAGGASAANARTAEQPRPIPLFLVIDDLGRWTEAMPTFLESLTQFIALHTRCHAVNWIFTLLDNEYPLVAPWASFWARYGLRRGGKWISTAGTTPTTERAVYSARSARRGILHVGGWIQLDEMNQHKRLGVSIIRSVLKADDDARLAFEQALEEIQEETARLLSSPFLAWIALDQQDALQLTRLVDLRFIELVQEYWNRCRAVLQSHVATGGWKGRLSALDLEQAVELIARALTSFSDAAPTITALLDQVTTLAHTGSELRDRSKAEEAVRVLAETGLVRINVDRGPGNTLGTVPVLELPFEMFWEWQVAREWVRLHGRPDADATLVVRQVAEEVARVASTRLRQGVFTFFLLSLDAKRSAIADLVDGVWLLGVQSQALFASTLMAAPKASAPSQVLLARRVVTEPLAELGRFVQDRYSIFAYLYFVANVSEDCLDTATRLQALQPYFREIEGAGLSGYYLYVVRRLLGAITDNDELVDCMSAFTGCERLGCAADIADLTIEVLRNNAADAPHAIGTCLIRYLKAVAPVVKQNYTPYLEGGTWKRWYYREWVLSGFCQFLVRAKGLAAFEMLSSWRWYEARRLGIEYPASLEMEREANIALGQWYQRSHDRERYAELVRTLSVSKQPRDRHLAFHLIRHSVPTEGEAGVVVDEVFHKVLRRLQHDHALKSITARFYDLFRLNLPELQHRARDRRRR